MKILLNRRSFRMNSMKLLTKIIETLWYRYEIQTIWRISIICGKNLLKLGSAIVSGCNGQTPSQNSISGNSSISVINILNNRISFLENELFKKDTIIDYLLNDSQKKWKKIFRFLWVWSNELITSIRSKSQDSTDSNRSANTSESITVDKYANDTIKETTNEDEK